MSTAEPAPAGAEAAGQGAWVGDLSEEELLAVITPLLPRGPQTPVGTGDDCAVLSFPDARTAVSTDVLVEGHHFRTEWSTGRDVGARAAAQNLADAAAMGATVVLRQVRTGEALCHHDPLRLAAAFRDAFEGALGDVTDLSGRDDM